MVYHIGINDIESDHWVAWVFDLHGCFSKSRSREKAIAGVPGIIKEYFLWISKHNPSFVPPEATIRVILAEDIKSYSVNDDYIVNAFFDHDSRLLTSDDIDEISRLLSYTRRDLNDVIACITPEQMDRHIEGEVQSTIRGILNHVATAERWYFDRIDLAFDRSKFPDDVVGKLKTVRKHTIAMLPELVGKGQVFLKRDERWSARKVLRRTLWHEIAHTRQIIRYLQTINKPQ